MEYIAYRSVRYMDFARATITRDIFISGPAQRGLRRNLTNRQNTQHITSLKRELAFPSTGSWLQSRLHLTLKRAHGVHFFQIRQKQTGHFK